MKKAFMFFMQYIGLFIVAGVFVYWAVTATDWFSAVLFSALAALDICLGISNIVGGRKKNG